MKHSVIYKIKEGKKESWLAWGKELETTFHDEAVVTLHEEGVRLEATFIFSMNSEDYVVGIMEGDDMQASNKEHKVNQLHDARKKECLEFVTKGESVYFFNVLK